MASPQENFRNQSQVRFNKIQGLDTFKNNIEKHFFSRVTVCDYSSESTSAKLVLELNCNLNLTEMLHHLGLGTWGNFDGDQLSFTQILKTLRDSNDFPIGIEELTIFLKDTSIVLNKIYAESIPDQLRAILQSVSENYVHFTKGLTEVPYEIYVPVFEEGFSEKNATQMNIKSGNNDSKDYFKYWGLYFDTEEHAQIYDLKNTSIISGDLQMLNW